MTDPTCTRVRLDPCHFLSRFFEIETLVNDCTGVRLDPSNMKLAFDLFFGLCWTKWGAGQMCSSLTTFLADASSIVHSDALLQMLKRGGETTGAFPNVQIWTMHPTVIQIERSLLHERVNKKTSLPNRPVEEWVRLAKAFPGYQLFSHWKRQPVG